MKPNIYIRDPYTESPKEQPRVIQNVVQNIENRNLIKPTWFDHEAHILRKGPFSHEVINNKTSAIDPKLVQERFQHSKAYRANEFHNSAVAFISEADQGIEKPLIIDDEIQVKKQKARQYSNREQTQNFELKMHFNQDQ